MSTVDTFDVCVKFEQVFVVLMSDMNNLMSRSQRMNNRRAGGICATEPWLSLYNNNTQCWALRPSIFKLNSEFGIEFSQLSHCEPRLKYELNDGHGGYPER